MKVILKHSLYLLALAATAAACARAPEATTSTTAGMSIEDQAAAELSWIDSAEDRQRVIDYAKAGQPELLYVAHEECPGDRAWQLGGSDHCVDPVRLPADVLRDIIAMNKDRFKADSDYDQRITKLYVFAHYGAYSMNMDHEEVAGIAEALNIAPELIGPMRSKRYGASDQGYLNILGHLFVGTDYQEDTSLARYVGALLKGVKVREYRFGPDEIGLYPGGGFGISFSILVTDRYMIYIKNEGWNS